MSYSESDNDDRIFYCPNCRDDNASVGVDDRCSHCGCPTVDTEREMVEVICEAVDDKWHEVRCDMTLEELEQVESVLKAVEDRLRLEAAKKDMRQYDGRLIEGLVKTVEKVSASTTAPTREAK